MKLAIKQPSESMPSLMIEEEEEEGMASAELQDMTEGEVELAMEEDGDEDVPMTIPADVSCIVPGCGRRHGRMCTFPVEGEMRAAWTSVLEAVFPSLDVNAPEPKLKLLCEDHFEQTDFDDRGLIQPSAVPTRFPGGVKVIYNSSGGEEPEPPAEQQEPPAAEPPPIACCVPGCSSVGPADSMFPFPEDIHRAWTSIISAATNKNVWKKGVIDPATKRPIDIRVCREHFVPENFDESGKALKPGAHPSLFDGGKKKVILRPSTAAQSSKAKPAAPAARKTYGTRTGKVDPAKKMGPVFVNVTDEGLQLVHKNGQTVQLDDLTLAELRRISDCLRDKLKSDVTEDERKNLNLCVTQVTPVLKKREEAEANAPETSAVMADLLTMNPDMNDPDVKRLVDGIRQVDTQRRDYERSLSRFFEDSDNFARESEALTLKINTLKRKISAMETTFLRFFKYNDQRRALMGAASVKWAVPSLTMARDIIQKVGKTAYGRLLKMGFPLPSADIVAISMERASAANVQWGLVDVQEDRSGATEQVVENGAAEEEGPAAKKSRTDSTSGVGDSVHAGGGDGDGDGADGDGADGAGGAGALQGITAEHLQDVLAGKGTLQDSQGRVIKVSLAEVPGAPPGAKTVVMETPDDAGEVRYVPSDSAAEA